MNKKLFLICFYNITSKNSVVDDDVLTCRRVKPGCQSCWLWLACLLLPKWRRIKFLRVLICRWRIRVFFSFLSFARIELTFVFDLKQVAESRVVFEARTIQRMELLVLSTLKWRMQAVTPFSFIDHFIRKMSSDESPAVARASISRSTELILSIVKGCSYFISTRLGNKVECVSDISWLWELNAGIDFLEFRPSEIAVAVAVAISIAGETQTVDTEKAISVVTEPVKKVKTLLVVLHYSNNPPLERKKIKLNVIGLGLLAFTLLSL